MPRYAYNALDGRGNSAPGTAEAADVGRLADQLKTQGLFLVDCRELEAEWKQARGASGAKPAAGVAAQAPKRYARADDRVPVKDLATFTAQLTIMVRTAVPLLEALHTLTGQQSNPVLKSVLQDICAEVRHGKALSAACARYENVFDEVVISLLAAGETGGNMDGMLERISAHLEFKRSLDGKARSSMMYPCVVIGTSVAVVGFLVIFVLPTFADVFAQFNMELPLPTRVLLGLSAHIRGWWLAYVLVGGFAWGKARKWLADPARVELLDELKLRIPVVGTMTRNLVLTRVLRTLAALTAAGVPILKALELARNSAGNAVFKKLMDDVGRHASEGRGLSSALLQNRYFPEVVANMIANAERTGTLPEVLNKVADHYERETDSAIKDVFGLMEPVFVVFLGLMVGGIAISIMMPMFQLSSGVG